MRVKLGLTLTIVLLLCPFAATAQTAMTQPGLFFTIANTCSAPVVGFAVGDELCLLQMDSAVFTRAIFQGVMVPGEKKGGMACAGKDRNGSVIFVPPPGTGIKAVVIAVTPDQIVSIPKTFCPSAATSERELLRRKK
jgi:hypothetical protein